MKSLIVFIGILFILTGVFTLSYQGITYTKQEKIAQIGDINVTADTTKKIHFPPILGGVSLIVGIALVVIGRR